MFACPKRGDAYKNPWLIVEVFGHVHDLKRVRTHWICHIEKWNNVSVKSRRRTKLHINLCGAPMQRWKCQWHKHGGHNLFSTHHLNDSIELFLFIKSFIWYNVQQCWFHLGKFQTPHFQSNWYVFWILSDIVFVSQIFQHSYCELNKVIVFCCNLVKVQTSRKIISWTTHFVYKIFIFDDFRLQINCQCWPVLFFVFTHKIPPRR